VIATVAEFGGFSARKVKKTVIFRALHNLNLTFYSSVARLIAASTKSWRLQMRFLVIGSGTTGGLIGARLVERGCDVSFLVRPARRAQLLTTGLALSSHFGRFRRPVIVVEPGALGDRVFDVVIIACRTQDYSGVLKLLVAHIGPETTVVLEGADHLVPELIPNGGRRVDGRPEARMSIDADGRLSQRLPAAELTIGALDEYETDRTETLTRLLDGRGVTTIATDRIRSVIWERYCLVAAAIAVNAKTGLPLRDAHKLSHHGSYLDRCLLEGYEIGRTLGSAPDFHRVRSYRSAYRMESRPVQPPELVRAPGRGAEQSVYLLQEMSAIARRVGVHVPQLMFARDALLRPTEVALDATDGGYSGSHKHQAGGP
jgi:2-dehydropantoate 2-reductase